MDLSLALWRRCTAEGLAAFALVFAGCGAIVTDARYHDALGAVGIALVFGLVIMVMVYATGHLSGAHINPAVTVAFTLTRHRETPSLTSELSSQVRLPARCFCSQPGRISRRISARPFRASTLGPPSYTSSS